MAFDFFVRRNGICIPLTCELLGGGAGEILIIRTMMMLYTMDACNLYLNLKGFGVLQFLSISRYNTRWVYSSVRIMLLCNHYY